MAAQGFLLIASFTDFIGTGETIEFGHGKGSSPPFRCRAWLALSVSSGGLLALPTTK